MVLLIVHLATLMATTLMTIFSHFLTRRMKLIFNEAHLLNILFDRTKGLRKKRENHNHIIGWSVHFGVGLMMAIALYFLFLTPFLMNTFLKALGWGIFAGGLGILGWLLLFNVYGVPERTSGRAFFIQLIFAHIIFTLTCYAVFRSFS